MKIIKKPWLLLNIGRYTSIYFFLFLYMILSFFMQKYILSEPFSGHFIPQISLFLIDKLSSKGT